MITDVDNGVAVGEAVACVSGTCPAARTCCTARTYINTTTKQANTVHTNSTLILQQNQNECILLGNTVNINIKRAHFFNR